MNRQPREFTEHGLYIVMHPDDRLHYVHNRFSWPAADRAITRGYGTSDEAAAAAKAIAADQERAKAGTKK